MARATHLLGVLLTGSAFLVACGQEDVSGPVETTRPVKTIVIGEGESGGLRNFPARIESRRRADLSFRVPGKLTEILVSEGETVTQDQEIAKLDPTDFQLVVDDRQAVLERAAKDFERAEGLIDKGFIPRKEYDRLEAELKSAQASLDQARQDLDYTILRAPFEGQISRRFVENFEQVQAQEPVMQMRDLGDLEVKIDVPEQIMIQARSSGENETLPPLQFFVSFSSAPGQQFEAQFREAAATADSSTQTFEVTFSLPTPEGLRVLPGMTANVSVDLSTRTGQSEIIFVPVEAVVAKNDLSPEIWYVDESKMTVHPKPVEVGSMRGGRIAVTEGLETGDRIVIAGVPFLVEGAEVTLMAQVEQAAEREEDAEIRRNAEENLVIEEEETIKEE